MNHLTMSSASQILESLEKKFSEPKYSRCVFKKCYDVNNNDKKCYRIWIVVLEKLVDTKTNEDREEIVDSKYAKFRANMLGVNEIFNVSDPSDTRKSITNEFLGRSCVYEVGKITFLDDYDNNIDNVCSRGIHYFKSFRAAYFFEYFPKMYSGKYVIWNDNGKVLVEHDVVNGEYTDTQLLKKLIDVLFRPQKSWGDLT